MNIIKFIKSFLKKIFVKEDVKLLESSVRKIKDESKSNFINSLKVYPKQNKNKVETLICYGDGLGIQTKIEC